MSALPAAPAGNADIGEMVYETTYTGLTVVAYRSGERLAETGSQQEDEEARQRNGGARRDGGRPAVGLRRVVRLHRGKQVPIVIHTSQGVQLAVHHPGRQATASGGHGGPRGTRVPGWVVHLHRGKQVPIVIFTSQGVQLAVHHPGHQSVASGGHGGHPDPCVPGWVVHLHQVKGFTVTTIFTIQVTSHGVQLATLLTTDRE